MQSRLPYGARSLSIFVAYFTAQRTGINNRFMPIYALFKSSTFTQPTTIYYKLKFAFACHMRCPKMKTRRRNKEKEPCVAFLARLVAYILTALSSGSERF